MLTTLQAIESEHVVNIKELQKSPSKHLKKITRILRGKKTLGYFLTMDALDELQEDIEAMLSPNFRKKIERSRASNTMYSVEEVKERYGLL